MTIHAGFIQTTSRPLYKQKTKSSREVRNGGNLEVVEHLVQDSEEGDERPAHVVPNNSSVLVKRKPQRCERDVDYGGQGHVI